MEKQPIPLREEYIHPKRDRRSDLFFAILDRMRKDGCMEVVEPILDYHLPKKEEPYEVREDTELTDCHFNLFSRIDFGGCEGIFVDLCLEGSFDASERRTIEIGTFKTLGEDLAACRLMGELCGMLIYHGTEYVNENIHRYTPQAQLEAEYQRYLENHMNNTEPAMNEHSDDQLKELLYEKMLAEQAEYKRNLCAKTAAEVLEEGYAYFSREDILIAVETSELSREQMLALLSLERPLDAVYEEWLAADYSQMEDIRDTLKTCADDLIRKAT